MCNIESLELSYINVALKGLETGQSRNVLLEFLQFSNIDKCNKAQRTRSVHPCICFIGITAGLVCIVISDLVFAVVTTSQLGLFLKKNAQCCKVE